MLIEKEKIIEAKEKLGENAANIIAEDLKLEQWDEKNLKSLCPFHNEDTPSFVWSIKDHAYKCFGCNKRYGIIDHFMNFYKLTYLGAVEKLFEMTDIHYRFGERGIKTNRDYNYPNHEQYKNRNKVQEYLNFRKISNDTLDYADVQQDSHENCVFHFYDSNDVLCTVKYRPARKLEKPDTKTWSQKDKDTLPILFNMNRIDPTKPLIITEGEIDCLSLIECGITNSVSVPFGANNYGWIETCWDFLEQFDQIIIWSDNDSAGLKMRKEVCSRLGNWRTLFVDIPEIEKDGEKYRAKDINEVLFVFGKDKVIELVNNAQEIPITGVENLANVADFDLEKAVGLYTHLRDLDNIVYKFLLGTVVLVTGQKGGGKSSLVNQAFVCEGLNQGMDCFIYSGEMGSSILKSWIELVMVGPEKIKMKDNFIHQIDPEARKQMASWYDERVWVYSEMDNKSEVILDKAINSTRKYGTKIWLLDNLMSIDIGATDSNLLQKQKEFIVRLTSLAKAYGVLIVLVVHPRKTMVGATITSDDIAGSSDIGNLAHYILSVHRYSPKEKEGERDTRGGYKKGKEPIPYDVRASILKNRITGKIGDCSLYFNYTSYRFYGNPKELYTRYKWDTRTDPIPTKDPDNHGVEIPEFISGD